MRIAAPAFAMPRSSGVLARRRLTPIPGPLDAAPTLECDVHGEQNPREVRLASDPLVSTVIVRLSRNEPLHLIARNPSDVTRAIDQAVATLRACGLSDEELEVRLGLLTVEIVGGAEPNRP